MTWVVILWCVLMAVWIIAALSSSGPNTNCVHHLYLSKQTCESVSTAGTGIGVVILWFVWFFGFIVLSLIWFMTRPKGRDCPACGEMAKKGHTTCQSCGYNFATAARGASAGAVGQSEALLASGAAAAPIAPPPQVSAGWFPDPSGSGNERYWDGGTWTPDVRKPQQG